MTTLAISLLALLTSALVGVSVAALHLWRTRARTQRLLAIQSAAVDLLFAALHEERRVMIQCEHCRPRLVVIMAHRRVEHEAAMALRAKPTPAAPRAAS